jgi:hypothetical protein
LEIKEDDAYGLNDKQLTQEKLKEKDTDNKGFSSRFRNKSDRKMKYYTSYGKPVYE